MTAMIKAVIFDMDGLMFDTEYPYIDLFEKICKEKNINFPKKCLYQLIGVSSHVVSKFEKDYPGIISVMNEVNNRYDDYFFELFKNSGDANKKGLKILFEYLDAHGYKKAIASSSREAHIRNLVSYCGFDMKLDAIVSSFSGIPSKPAPDVFLKAAKELNERPENCLVLEDSKFGTMAAYRANMHRVCIPDILEIDDEMRKYVEYECSNLEEVINILESKF